MYQREKSPIDVLDPARRGIPRYPVCRGIVVGVNVKSTTTGVAAAANQQQVALTCNVRPLTGGGAGGAGNLYNDVPIAFSSVGSSVDAGSLVSGMFALPRIGAEAILLYDGTRYIIIGFLPGLVRAADGSRTYNQGVDAASTVLAGQPGWEQIPEWAGAFEPGDISLSNEGARLKLSAIGVFIGGSATAMSVYKKSGQRIDRAGTTEERNVGFWRVQTFSLGATTPQTLITQLAAGSLPSPTAYVYRCEVIDTHPYAEYGGAYTIHQRGFIPAGGRAYGRSGVYAAFLPTEVATERAAKTYSVMRDAVMQPLVPGVVPPAVQPELAMGLATLAYDHQVDADGSFREAAGNAAHVPGTAEVLDLHVTYDVSTQTYTIKLGTTGAMVKMRGTTPLTSSVEVRAARITIDASISEEHRALVRKDSAQTSYSIEAPVITITGTGAVNVTAPLVNVLAQTLARVTAPLVSLEGNVSVVGSLTVTGAFVTLGAATMGGVPYLGHAHSYVSPGGPALTGPPT